MALKNKIKITNETLLLIVGSLLLIIAFLLFNYEKIIEISNDIYSSIQTEIFKEQTRRNISVNISVDYVENDNDLSNQNNETQYKPNYIAFLEIEKINLRQGLLPINNYYNKVDYHVQILDISDMPDVVNGNLILAGHSGTSNVSFFKNLNKKEKGDNAKIYYDSNVYNYQIVDIYQEDKDGSVNIYRNTDKTTLTLITCTKNDKSHQTIYILELIGVETY